MTGSFNGALLIGELLILAQVTFGVVLYIKGYRAESSIHILYGLTAVLALPFIWSYMKDQTPARRCCSSVWARCSLRESQYEE